MDYWEGKPLQFGKGVRQWENVPLDTDSNLRRIFFADAAHGWVVGERGVIYHTDNSGITWENQETDTDDTLETVQFVDGIHGWANGKSASASWPLRWSHVLLSTSDGGKTWVTLGNENALSLRSISFVNIKDGWAIDYEDNIVHTADGGRTWTKQASSLGSLTSILFINAD